MIASTVFRTFIVTWRGALLRLVQRGLMLQPRMMDIIR